MSTYSLKKFALTLSCLLTCSASFADDASQSIAASGAVTNAIAFSIQAGQIAGAAQACGLDVSVFTVRVSEAINKLALNPTDKMAATDSFQKTLGQAQAIQTANHPIACSQVTQDFNSLPILRSDYEQTVISQLTPGASNNNSAQTNTTTNQQNQQQTPNTTNQNQPTNSTTQQQQSNTNSTQQQTTNSATNNNPAYGSPNNNQYNAYTPTRNNYDNAINSLNTTNQQSLNQTQSSSSSQPTNTTNTQTNTATTNNPPPPSFTNPNNTPTTTGGY